MANYYGMTRTNYFAVTDADRFKEIVGKLDGEGEIGYYEHEDDKGKFMFYCECNLNGYIEDEDDEDSWDNAWDNMVRQLQTILPKGEAIIITDVGNEKMRYLTARSLIITANSTTCVDLGEVALAEAARALGNPGYTTQMDY